MNAKTNNKTNATIQEVNAELEEAIIERYKRSHNYCNLLVTLGFIRSHPDMSTQVIAKMLNTSERRIYILRKEFSL